MNQFQSQERNELAELAVADDLLPVDWVLQQPPLEEASPASASESKAPRSGRDSFATTQWSVVLTAGSTDSDHAAEALAQLCCLYWLPLFTYIRRCGYTLHDAQDLTQEFFARLLVKKYLAQVNPARGRFRCFLLASLKHFLANERDRADSAKRGGQYSFVPWDDTHLESECSTQWSLERTAESAYERQWALTLLGDVFARLGDECAAAGKAHMFETLRIYLSGENGDSTYAKAAARLNMSPGAVQVAVHRLRRRYGELLRAAVAYTVSRPEEINGEIRYLFNALGV